MNRRSTRPPRLLTLAALAFLAVFSPLGAHADSTGPLAPTTIDTAEGQPAWTDPAAATTEDDLFASINLSDTTLESSLAASDFAFDLPPGSVVTGIEVTVSRHSDTGVVPGGVSGGLLMTLDGTTSPEEDLQADVAAWDTTDIVSVLGGDGVLWGLDLTLEDVNDAAFTVLYRVATTADLADDDTYSVDSITAEVFFEPPVLLDPCDSFPQADNNLLFFAETYFEGSDDIDVDGLPDLYSLALLEEVSCNPVAPESLTEATFNAYNLNLLTLAEEPEGLEIGIHWDIIAMLSAMSAGFTEAIVESLAASDPPVILSGTYIAVTCEGEDCQPLDSFRAGSTRASRAVDEPYSATGDLDNDTFDNLTEYTNVIAQGGETFDFVVAATSPELDGTEPIITPGGGGSGGCFIATAALGTPLADEIGVLRGLRDQVLLQTSFGAAFVDTYYRLSPPIADRVAANKVIAALVRIVLVPVIALAKFPFAAFALAVVALLATFRARHRRLVRAR